MNHTPSKLFDLPATVLCLTACEKNKEDALREIVYTVNAEEHRVTTHTEPEWDALLEHFCDYTQEGVQVMFCSTHQPGQRQAQGRSSHTPTSITTSNRDELKAWMKEMERAGHTVNVKYDNVRGTRSGTAYVDPNRQEEQAERKTYSGTFLFIPTPAVQERPPGGTVWTVEVGADTLIITVHGMMIWSASSDAGMPMIDSAEAVLEGIKGSYSDLHGETFLTLELKYRGIKKNTRL